MAFDWQIETFEAPEVMNVKTISSMNGNKMKAASNLGIRRRALYNKLKRFGMLVCIMCT
jgi:DNA-binding protein Fis